METSSPSDGVATTADYVVFSVTYWGGFLVSLIRYGNVWWGPLAAIAWMLFVYQVMGSFIIAKWIMANPGEFDQYREEVPPAVIRRAQVNVVLKGPWLAHGWARAHKR